MTTPELELATGFILDERGRIVSTREPHPTRGPLFTLIRSVTRSAWAVRDDVPNRMAAEMAALAREEPSSEDLGVPPIHAERYLALSGGQVGFTGPAFRFPDALPPVSGVIRIEDDRELQHHFRGWKPGEIAEGRGPVLAVVEEGRPASICFCARQSGTAAAAGLETAERFRGRGFGARVTLAWALAIRGMGKIPLYSADWSNAPSRAVARKLGLCAYASFWSISA